MKRILLVLLIFNFQFSIFNLFATVYPFSMAEEAANQNTPSGWTAVQLPANLPTLTEANTFVITEAPYNASTSSADNTAAIQAALDAAANAGGGMVVIPAGTFLSGYLTVGSKTIIHLCENATLQMLPMTSFGTDANGYHKMNAPFITGKSGASDIVIEGESRTTSIIDGQGAPWWDEVEDAKSAKKSTTRAALIRIYQGNRYLFRNFRIQNAPNTNITIGNGGNGAHATAHAITISNPSSEAADPSHNTDGFPIWTDHVNIYDCYIDTGDDNVVCDRYAQFVHVWDCDLKAGHGASFGSYTTGMHDIIYEDLRLDGTDSGFRLKSNNDRSGDVYNIIFRNVTMTNVANPISITCWYDSLPQSPAYIAAHPQDSTAMTPVFHDILIQNVTASGDTQYKYGNANSEKDRKYFGVFIYGRPESLVRNVTFDNVNITHSKGLKLNFCDGIAFKNCSFTVSNTNMTSKNGASTDAGIPDVLIEQKYQGSYTWNDKVTLDKSILSWYMGTDGAAATAANSITGAAGSAAEGFTIAITGNTGKNWSSGNGDITYAGTTYKTLKNSNGAQNTVTLPAGQYAHKVEFYAVANNNESAGKLSEFNGTACDEAVSSLQDYSHPTYIAKKFSTGVNSFTFTFSTKQVCFIAIVTHNDMQVLPESGEPDSVEIRYYDTDGTTIIGRDSVEAGSVLAYKYGASDVTVTDGKVFRGWFEGTSPVATKVLEGTVVNEDLRLYAQEREIEVAAVGKVFEYDFRQSAFDPAEHELLTLNGGSYHGAQHGWAFGTNGSVSIDVAGNALIQLALCQYGNASEITCVDGASQAVGEPITLPVAKDGNTGIFRYSGSATTLTFTLSNGGYIHKMKVYNVAQVPTVNEAGYYVMTANDGAGLLLMLETASAGDKIFLPNGTYDFGSTTLTEINASISLIGQSMDSVLIVNHPLPAGMNNSETLHLRASGIYMQDLAVRCDVSYAGSTASGVGIALQDRGDKNIMKRVDLQGNQDTYLSSGHPTQRGYFEDGRIEGTVDYICGGGNIWFENILFYNNDRSNADVIFAPNTDEATVYGYVLNNCTIDGAAGQAGRWNLARGWQKSPAVTFLNTTCKIAPSTKGYTNMGADLVCRFHEYNTNLEDGTAITGHNLDGLGYADNSDAIYMTSDSIYTYANVILGNDNWDAAAIAAQVTADPEAIDEDAAYLVENDGAFVAIVKGSELASYTGKTIRQANTRGGFGAAVVYNPGGADIDQIVHRTSSNRKFIKDGQFLILRDGRTYNALGVEVK